MEDKNNITSQNQNTPVEITHYTDYAEYLTDLIKFKKATSSFSYRVFCQKSGFKSPSYLKWAANGTRAISLKSVHKFISGLSLNKREATYFVLMVNYKESTDPQTKRFYYEQMLASQKKEAALESKDAYEYLSHWYYVAIRELIGSPDFSEDPKWISNRLGSSLTVWDVKNAIETLERLKLIKRNLHGKWEQSESNLRTEHDVKSLAAFNYHVEMLDLANDTLSKRNAKERDFQSIMAIIDHETFTELKSKIQKFQNELIEFLMQKEKQPNNKTAQKELYALNTHLIPLSVPLKGDK